MRTLGEIQPGQTVGRYEFLVPIAQGGMAAVWAARLKGTRGFSKNVAVKMMLPTISDDPQFEQMFLDEAQIASRIRHPNVCEILDLGEQDDLLYLVMEWVDGEPLSNIRRAAAKKEGIPRPIAVKIVADAAAGLHAAHELKDEEGKTVGIVHRDISPQNILITFDGVVKIVDFGVAKAAGRTSESTSAGQIKGKPPYMSPEQALGQDVDRRTDVFALGIILYQLSTGKHPFRGESDVVTLQNIVSDRPIIPPRAYDREYPKPLEAVVMKALERDAAKRFQSAAELEAALDRVFPPTVPRVRTEDVGKFVSAMLGDRGEERRSALRDAIKLADERAAGAEALPSALGRPLGELGTTVGMALAPPRAHLASSPSQPSNVTGPTPGSIGSIPLVPPAASAPSELSSSGQISLPNQTPFGTQTPTAPPAAPKSRGALWVIGGVALAALFVVGALVLTNKLGGSPSAEGAPTAPVAAADPPEPAAPLAPDEPPPPSELPAASAAGDSIDVSQLEMEKTARNPGRPIVKTAPKATTEPKKEPKKKEEEKKKPGTGFVPPPVSDPGF
jgi:eukaryotic-like serine/threonine-protein kinase